VRLKTALVAHPIATAVILLALVGVAAAAVPAFNASEQPKFCTTCHEMQPYYDAWSVGAHRNTSCVSCHVDGGTVNHVKHKVVAAGELWTHFTGDPRFPQGTAEVPDARCLACHSDIPASTGATFSHKQHAKGLACIDCHRTVGHSVTTSSLSKAGVLATATAATSATVKPVPAVASLAATGSSDPTASSSPATGALAAGESSAALHVEVVCSKCHNLDTTACSTCHKPAHQVRGECTTCHRPAATWTFTHPASQKCSSCHASPASHRKGTCLTCHTQPGVSWAFSHPTSTKCASCHTPPKNHFGKSCTTCHKVSVAFAKTKFVHINGVNCGKCHNAPSRHFGSSCNSCHKVGARFASARYRHNMAVSCTKCHSRPSGHRSGSCSSCHRRAGVSWAFSHPSSRSCASCHRAPKSHYGSSCASCHRRPGRSWAASFHHPSTGEHSYRSFACAKCHPSGYRSASCTCHGGHPPSDD
jgi:cytochrome c nitrite reductase small subunit